MHSELEPVVAPWMNEELTLFREVVDRFVTERMVPHDARWRREHCVGREIWREAGEAGLLCTDIPAEYGGGGGDFRHESIVHEALARRGLVGFARVCTASVRSTSIGTALMSRSSVGYRGWLVVSWLARSR